MKPKTLFLCAVFAFLPARAPAQDTLTLDAYLAQVRQNNPDIKSAELSLDSMGKKILEMDMIYSPLLITNYTSIEDKTLSLGSTLATNEMRTNAFYASLSKKFFTGSTLSLNYTNSDATLDLLAPYTFTPGLSSSHIRGRDLKPSLRLDQSLLRDFMAKLTDAGINKQKALVRAGQYMQLLRSQRILLQTRSAYMMLSLDREIVEFRTAELGRVQEILKWNENRVNLDLADKGDLLQTRALVKMRQLNLQMALEDQKNAERDFNALRHMPAGTPIGRIESLSSLVELSQHVPALEKTGSRADVYAAQEQYESSRYAETETKYRSYPEINLFAVGAYDTMKADTNIGMGVIPMTIDDNKPVYTLGVNLIVPLDIGTLKKVREGYDLDYKSAKETLDSAQISADNDWQKLTENWTNVQARLKLAQEMKQAQAERLENEQYKFRKGRTMTFQLLSAENDLDDATINTYRMMLEELMTYFQAELYNTKQL